MFHHRDVSASVLMEVKFFRYYVSLLVFTQIEGSLPNISRQDPSTDQRYLCDMCNAISKGVCSEQLPQHDPGALSHLRWLTAANRLLR